MSEKVRFPQHEFEQKTSQKKCPKFIWLLFTSRDEVTWSSLLELHWLGLQLPMQSTWQHHCQSLLRCPGLFWEYMSNWIYSNTSNLSSWRYFLGEFLVPGCTRSLQSFGKTPQCTEAKEASKGTREHGNSPGKQWKKTAQKIILFKTQLAGKFVNKTAQIEFAASKVFPTEMRDVSSKDEKAKVAMDNAAGSLKNHFCWRNVSQRGKDESYIHT